MVITSTISVHHRLHCVRINACVHLECISYNRVCEVHHIILSLVTVGNNVNRRDDAARARYTAANGVLFTVRWNSFCIKVIKCSY